MSCGRHGILEGYLDVKVIYTGGRAYELSKLNP